MCGQSIVYNIYATLANTNLLFMGFSCSQNVSFSSQRDNNRDTRNPCKLWLNSDKELIYLSTVS